MRADGWLMRMRSSTDRRKSIVMLSPRGLDVIDQLLDCRRVEATSVLRNLELGQLEVLNELLESLLASVASAPSGGSNRRQSPCGGPRNDLASRDRRSPSSVVETLHAECLLLAAAPGCSRQFWRRQADMDVYDAEAEKLMDSRWALPRVDVTPDPRSRFFDPYDPDKPPLPRMIRTRTSSCTAWMDGKGTRGGTNLVTPSRSRIRSGLRHLA